MQAPPRQHQAPECVHRDEGENGRPSAGRGRRTRCRFRGGEMLFVQYPGPLTGGRPVCDGRFNMTARKLLAEERTDR
jgi:hypothetical protein